MKLHHSLTPERIMACAEESMFGMADNGFCVACGEDYYGCEPDARGYLCPQCGQMAVYGGEELLHEVA